MTYDEVLERIYRMRRFGWKLGLERIDALLDFLGRPERGFPAIQVGGSNGKGSVVAALDSILRSAGYRVGRYTSPHLFDFRERITVNGTPISKREVVAFYRRVAPFIRERSEGGDNITFFELATGLAFEYFACRRVDVAVVEVGLGGRYDATSILQRVMVTVLCSICREHRDVLGESLGKIAAEKSALIRKGTVVLCARQRRRAARVIDARAKRQRAAVRLFGRDFTVRPARLGPDGSLFDFRMGETHLEGLEFPLAGEHQLENAALAVAACRELPGFRIRAADIRTGLRRTNWPGRLEVVGKKPLVVVDTACNPSALRASLAFAGRAWPDKKKRVVFALLKDKDLAGMARLLARQAKAVYVVPAGEGRGREPSSICRTLRRTGLACHSFSRAAAGLRRAKKEAGAEEMVLVTGSLFLVAEVMRSINKRRKKKEVRSKKGEKSVLSLVAGRSSLVPVDAPATRDPSTRGVCPEKATAHRRASSGRSRGKRKKEKG